MFFGDGDYVNIRVYLTDIFRKGKKETIRVKGKDLERERESDRELNQK